MDESVSDSRDEPLAGESAGAPHPLRRGARAGAVAGVVTVAAMYVASALVGTKPLPDLLQQPILAVMPGPVFGFLIDNLQHLGKVIEEAGLIVMLIAVAALAGALFAWLERRRARSAALLVAGAGWLLLMVVVLPVTGDGFFALREGLTAPVVWLLLFVLYAVALQLAYRPLDEETDPQRRRMLRLVPVGLGVLGLGVLGVRLLPNWYASVARPPEAGVTGPSPEITPVANFYVVSKNFSDPVVSADGWTLRVFGMVDRELRLSYSDLRARPSVSEYVTFECISNDVGGPLISTGRFTGLRLRDLLGEASPRGSARIVAYRAADGFTESYPLSLVMAAPEILVAYDLDGSPLPNQHGFPARIVLPGHYGMKQPKWLQSIELRTDDPGGFWEQQGWDPNAIVKTNARFDYPRDGFIVKRGLIHVAGVAYAGTNGISSVEVSVDGGRSWRGATLKPALSAFTWRLWSFDWTPSVEGVYSLKVRATDGHGRPQDSRDTPSFPSGATGYHAIQVTVSR